jgi:hypothetical protein
MELSLADWVGIDHHATQAEGLSHPVANRRGRERSDKGEMDVWDRG